MVAAFDAGAVTSDAGALLLGATDRAIKMMDRFAGCFHDERRQDLIEHKVVTLVGQRVFGIALGYEDLNDHDELRHDHRTRSSLIWMQPMIRSMAIRRDGSSTPITIVTCMGFFLSSSIFGTVLLPSYRGISALGACSTLPPPPPYAAGVV